MAGMRVVVVASTAEGNIDVEDLKAKAEAHRERPGGADGDVSLDARRVRRKHPGHLRHRPRPRRPGLHGRREHERAGRPDQSRPPSAPTSAISICTKRSASPTAAAAPAWARSASPTHLAPFLPGHPLIKTGGAQGDSRAGRRPLVERQHPADLLRLHQDAGRRRHDRRDALRHPQRELHQVAPGSPLSGALHARKRPRRARNDLRSAPAESREAASTKPTSPSA